MSTTVPADPPVDEYPSRVDDHPRLVPRKEPVMCERHVDGPLSAAHLRRYDSLGYLIFERFFTAEELSPHLAELERLRADPTVRSRPETITEPTSEEFRSIFAVHESNDVLSRLSRSPRLVAIARQLLGAEVYIHQSRVSYEPGYRGRELFWRSAFETWHVEDGMPRMRAVSCSISLNGDHPANGPLMVIPSSHRMFLACKAASTESDARRERGAPDEESLRKMAEEAGIEPLAGPAGSVIFFECNLMHGWSSNITPWPRSSLFTAFNSVDNALVDPYGGDEPRPQFLANRRDTSPLPVA